MICLAWPERLGPSYPTAKCEISLMSSPFSIFYIFHQFNYISATKLQRLIAYSSLTRKHFFKKVRMKISLLGEGRAWGGVGSCRSSWRESSEWFQLWLYGCSYLRGRVCGDFRQPREVGAMSVLEPCMRPWVCGACSWAYGSCMLAVLLSSKSYFHFHVTFLPQHKRSLSPHTC